MLYARQRPGPQLADHVAYYWSLRDAPHHSLERIVPSGTLELVVNLHDDQVRVYDPTGTVCRRLSGAVVSGAYRQYFVIDTRVHASMVGVHFKPGGAAAFLGVAPGELADRHVDLDALWGSAAIALRERLCAASTDRDRFAALEAALLTRMQAHREGHPVVPFALQQLSKPGVTVGEVASDVELSRRRLITVFTAEVGMTPKRLSRVMRFQRAAALVRRSAAPDWARLAVECGYFDQSHLIRDVGEFAGTSPAQLRPAGAHVKELHLAIAEGSNSSNTPLASDHNVRSCGRSSHFSGSLSGP
jgi:AraC-like DNA-binding protein